MSPRKKTTKINPTVLAAIITAIGAVIVATVTGYFGFLQKVDHTKISSQKFEVLSTQPWQTAASLQEGDWVSITYLSGKWTNNADYVDSTSPYVDSIGYLPDFRNQYDGFNLAALIIRIGDGTSFALGSDKHKDFQSTSSGSLEFQINDDGLSNNGGSIVVEIVITKK